MTPQEIEAAIEAGNVELLKKQGLPVSRAMIDLLNLAGMRGFQIGGDMALSMVKGALAVQLAKIDK